MRTLQTLLCTLLLLTAAMAQNASSPPDLIGAHLNLPLLALPAPVTGAEVQLVGQGGTSFYNYWIVAQFTIGPSIVAGPFPGYRAPQTLSGSNYFRIGWSRVIGATSYDVLRTAGFTMPQGACACAVATGVTATTQNDQSNSLSGYTVGSFNPQTHTHVLDTEAVAAATAHLILRHDGANGAIAGDLSNAASMSNVTTQTGASYNALASDGLILAAYASGNQGIVLPVTGIAVGKIYVVKVASAGVPVNVTAVGGAAIDLWSGGQVQLWNPPTTTQNGSSVMVQWDGTQYWVIGST